MRRRKPYRNGFVHVKVRMCPTCIFRPGNLMALDPGRAEEMVAQATRQQSAIICHETLEGLQAICRGFYDRHPTAPLILAEKMGCMKWQED